MGITSLLLLLVLSLPGSSPSDATLLNRSKRQAEHYLFQIQQKRQLELNLWALSQLCDSKPKVKQYIDKLSSSKSGVNLPIRPFCSNNTSEELIKKLAFKIQSPKLLTVSVLLQSSSLAQKKLFHTYAEEIGFEGKKAAKYRNLISHLINKQAINEETLSYENFELVHFLIFFNNDLLRNGVLTTDYLKRASSYWLASKTNFRRSTLSNSLQKAALFRALYILDRYSDLEPLYVDLTQDKLFPTSSLLRVIYRALDYSMYRLGHYDRSLYVSRTFSVPLARFFEDRQTELADLIRQAAYLIKIGKMKEAQEINLKVLEQSTENDIRINRSSLYTNLSITYLKMGDYDRYLELQFKALKEAKEENNYSHQLDILNNLYIYYRQNGDHRTASLYLEEATELAEVYGSKEDLGVIYTYLGTFYKKFQQDYPASKEYFEKAQSVLDKKNHFDSYLNLLFEKGKLYEELRDYGQALVTFNKVIALSREKSIKHLFESLVNKTAVYLELNQLNKAKQSLSEINSIDFSQIDFEDIVYAKTVQADYLLKTGKSEEAHALLKPVIEQTVDWAQNSADTQTGFWNIEQEFLNAFQLMADLLIKTGRSAEAVEVLDKLKTINDASLYQNPMVKSSLLTESELAQYQRLTTRLDQLRKDLLASSGSRHLELQSHINRLSAQKRTLDHKITSLVGNEPARIRNIQQQLSGYEAIIHTTELNNWYYIATIFRNKVKFEKVRLDSSIRTVFSESVRHLASGKTNLNELYQVSEILGLNRLPSWISKLIVIPDSYLYQIPIDILPLTKPDSRHSYGSSVYLVERFNTHYLTSLNDLNTQPDNHRNYKWNFVGYGVSDFQLYTDESLVPLPYAQTEVEGILSNLTNLTDKAVFVDSLANKNTFKATAKNARILHLATHSEVSERDPLFSSIYLSQYNSNKNASFPGQIFAHELFGLNLSNDLIMLNSCESGSGSYLQGTGVMGISRALRYAGANSLILNLWSVNDMLASEFAIQFYKQLNKGQTKAEALRTAKIHMLKNSNANPHYWGTYVLIGKNNSILEPSKRTNIYLASSFMLYFVILIILTVLKDKILVIRQRFSFSWS